MEKRFIFQIIQLLLIRKILIQINFSVKMVYTFVQQLENYKTSKNFLRKKRRKS